LIFISINKKEERMTLVSEHYYPDVGVMKPVVCGGGVNRVRFALDGAEGDVQVTYDPLPVVKKGRAEWLTHLGGSAGEVGDVTALRAVIRNVDGWAKLTVAEIMEGRHG
jgi:hypothetical protein